MAENTIQRVIEVDTSASVKTVRELQAEVEKARKALAELQAGADGYAAAAKRAATAEQQLAEAMDIAEDSNAQRLATARELAEAEARQAEEVNKLIDTLSEYRDAGYDVTESLEGVSTATEQATRTTQELDAGVNKLRESGAELIETLVKDQEELAEITAQRKALNKEIAKGIITEEQAREVKGELLAQETVYKARISETRQELTSLNKEVQAADGSYNAMSQTLGRLKAEFRELSADQRNGIVGEDLLKHINDLDQELKNLDASIGNHQRNVGNYESAIDKLLPGFSQLLGYVKDLSGETPTLSGVVQGAAASVKNLTKEAMAFIMTPLGATLATLLVAYKTIKSAIDDLSATIEGNITLQQQQQKEQAKVSAWQIEEQKILEESASRWIKVRGGIAEAWEALKIFYKYGSSLQFGTLWQIVTGVKETKAAMENIEDLKKELHELQVGDPDNQRLGSIEKVAELESEIGLLKVKAADKENNSDEEREEALRQAIEKNKEMYAIKRQELDIQLMIAEAQHKASPDDAQFQQEWVKLRAQRKQLIAQEANSERMLIRSLSKFAVDESADTSKKAAEEWARASKEAAEATEKTMRDTLKIQQGLREKTLENELQTAKENYEQELADFNKTVKEKRISEEAAAEYRKALAEKNEADIAEIRKKYADKQADELTREWEKELEREKQQQQIKLDALDNDMDSADRQAQRDEITAKQTITDPQALEQELQEIQQRLYESKIALIDEMINNGDLDFDTITELSNRRADLEIANDNRVLENQRKNQEEKNKLAELDKKRQQQTLAASASFLDSMSQLAGENTAAGKAMAVSSAIISTYLSAQQAYQAAFMPVPTPASPILGAINMAAAIASGLMNVKSILSVNEKGTTSVPAANPAATASAVVTPPAVIEQVPLTRTLTSASEEERLNQMANPQRVVLVYSDVEEAARNVEVQQMESTF